MIPDRLYELAFAYRKLKLWDHLWDTEVFAVERDNGERLFICVMGRLGTQHSLAVYTESEFHTFYQFLDLSEGIDYESGFFMFCEVMVQSCTLCSFENKDRLLPEEIEEVRAYTKAHGIRLAGKNAWPQFERYRPHKMRWKVEDPEDREHLADALEAGIELGRLFAEDPAAAAELGFNDVRLGDIREVPLLRRNDGVYVIDGTASLPQPAEEDYPKGPAPDPDTVKKLKSKFRKGAIECGVIWLPQPVQEAEDQVPYYPVMLMAVQAHSGMVLPVEIVKDYDNDREELLSNFLRALGTQKNLPKLWKVHDMRTYRLLDAAAESLGAKLELHDRMDLRALAEAQDALMESMGFGSVYDDDNTFSDLEEMLNGMEYVVNELHVEIPGDIQASMREMLKHEILPEELEERIRGLLEGAGKGRSGGSGGSDGKNGRLSQKSPGADRKTAPDVLSEKDSKLFYDLWFPLLDYVNKTFRVNKKLRKMTGASSLDPIEVKKVADYLWEHAGIIKDYLKTEGRDLPAESKDILTGWMRCKKGVFALERHLKKGSILISLDDETVYKAVGIVSSWKEMFIMSDLPVLFEGTLIPFRDVIISDGLIMERPLRIGPNLRQHFKDLYMEAKRAGKIITSL